MADPIVSAAMRPLLLAHKNHLRQSLPHDIITTIDIHLEQGCTDEEAYSIIHRIHEYVKPHKSFFRDLTLSQQDIDSRFRRMSVVLHPDRVKRDLSRRIKKKIAELFEQLHSQRVFYSTRYDCCSSYDFHLHEAKIFYDLALQFQGVPRFAELYSNKAVSQYREICRLADNSRDTANMVTYRTKVAAMYVLQHRYLEAQIYTLGAMRIVKRLYTHQPERQSALVSQLAKNLTNIKKKACPPEHEAAAVATNVDDAPRPPPASAMDLSKHGEVCSDLALSGDNSDSRLVVSTALCHVLTPNRSLVELNIPTSAIRAKEKVAWVQSAKGYGVATVGLAGGGAVAASGAYTVATTVAAVATGTVLAGPVALIGLGMASIFGGGWFAVKLFKQSSAIRNEVNIRKDINAILDRSIALYHSRDYCGFLTALATPIASDSNKQIISFDANHLTTPVDIHTTISYLYSREVRPDGVAYILNGVGEALASGTIPVRTNELNLVANANEVFSRIISSKELENQARTFDTAQGRELNSVGYVGALLLHMIGWSRDLSDEETAAASSALAGMSVTSRLVEVVNVAKMNLALMLVVDDDAKSVTLAREMLDDILAAYTNSPALEVITEKIETLRDFMMAFGMESVQRIGYDTAGAANAMEEGLLRDVYRAVYNNDDSRDRLINIEKNVTAADITQDPLIFSRFYLQLALNSIKELASLEGTRQVNCGDSAVIIETWTRYCTQLKDALVRFFNFCNGDDPAASLLGGNQCRVVVDIVKTVFALWCPNYELSEKVQVAFGRLLRERELLQSLLLCHLPTLFARVTHQTVTAGGASATVTTTSYYRQGDSFPVLCNDSPSLLKQFIMSGDDSSMLALLGDAYFTGEPLLTCVETMYELEDVFDGNFEDFLQRLRVKCSRVYDAFDRSLGNCALDYLRQPYPDADAELMAFIRIKTDRMDAKNSDQEKVAWFRRVIRSIGDSTLKQKFKTLFQPWAELARAEFANNNVNNNSPNTTSSRFREQLSQLVIGQEPAVRIVGNALGSSASRSYFLPGPSGVGKTELAKAVALIKFEDRMLRLNMNDYQGDSSLANMIGSPSGYVGSDQPGALVVEYIRIVKGGDLASSVHRRCVILLDEFDKAHDTVQKFFLTMLDESYFTARGGGHGSPLHRFSTAGCIIMITSNLFSREIVEWHSDGRSSADMREDYRNVNRALVRIADEVLGRCELIPFIPLNREECKQVVAIKLSKLTTKICDVLKCKAASVCDNDSSRIQDFICDATRIYGSQMRLIDQYLARSIYDILAGHGSNIFLKVVEFTMKDGEEAPTASIYYYDNELEERANRYDQFVWSSE